MRPLPILALALGLALFLGAGTELGAEEGRRTPMIALVLSGGSAFGIAHIGVLEEIEAAGIPIDLVVGTSMGSIVGGMYVSGYSPQAMADILAGLDWNSVFLDNRSSAGDRFERRIRQNYSLRLGFEKRGVVLGEGLLQGQNILGFFTELTAQNLAVRDFDDFPVHYRAVATDILTGDKVVLDSGSLAEAMRASMSIPGLFRPYVLEGRSLVDGGVVDDLPVDVARALGADLVIAVESRGPDTIDPAALSSPMDIAGQTANIMILQNLKPSRAAADLYIKCDLHGFTTASYMASRALIDRGREAGRAARAGLAELAAKIASKRPLVTPATEPNRVALAQPPRMLSLRVEGGDQGDAGLVAQAFSALVGRPYTREELKTAIDGVYLSGRFDLVKFRYEKEGEGLRGVVSLRSDASSNRSFLLGFDYTGIFSSDSSNSFTLSPALFLQDLSGKDSAFYASASLVNRLRLGLEYFQPFGAFYLAPWFRYDAEDEGPSLSDAGLGGRGRFQALGGGLWTGLAVGKDSDLALGYSLESLSSSFFPDAGLKIVGALRAVVALDGRNASAFPERGLAFFGFGRLSTPGLGSEFSFAQVEAGLDAVIPLGRVGRTRNFLDLALFAGSDLAGLIPGFDPAPKAYFSSLHHPGMFIGLLPTAPYAAADHVAGLSLEYRRRLAGMQSLIGRLFFFGNLSLGASLGAGETLDRARVLWSGSGGVEVQLARNLGLQVGLGLTNGNSASGGLAGALSFALSPFLEGPEARR